MPPCKGNCENCIAELLETSGLKFGAVHTQIMSKIQPANLSQNQQANLGGNFGETDIEEQTETETVQPKINDGSEPHVITTANGIRVLLPRGKKSIATNV